VNSRALITGRLTLAAALAAFALLVVASGAVAQEQGYVEDMVVMKIHAKTESYNVPLKVGAMTADAYGLGSSKNVKYLNGILGYLFSQLGGMGLPSDLVGGLESASSEARDALLDEMDHPAEPTTESMDYTVYLQSDLFRLEADGFTMIWRAGQMWYTDPSTGRLTLASLEKAEDASRTIRYSGADPTPLGQTQVLLGHEARGYQYDYEMSVPLPPGLELANENDEGASGTVETKVEAWIASDLPEADQITAFYRNFANAFADQQGMMGGNAEGMARLAALGVPLKTTETSEVYMMFPGGGDGGLVKALVRKSISTTTVTEISTRPLGDEFSEEPPQPSVAGAPGEETPPPGQQPPPCDCSCAAFEALKKLDKDDPNALAKAQCAKHCMSKWVKCAGG
jgi:hypothetical protein